MPTPSTLSVPFKPMLPQSTDPGQIGLVFGIGNIAGAIISGTESRHMVSMNGIIGQEVRTFREFTYPWGKQALMVLHSDGLGTRWDLSNYPGLLHKPCGLIAGVLYRTTGTVNDDFTASRFLRPGRSGRRSFIAT